MTFCRTGLSGQNLLNRSIKLHNMLKDCCLCPRRCSVDRNITTGYCRSGIRAGVASFNVHFGEEPFLSGSRGSGTVFFHHCTLCCSFCQNYPVSQLHSFPEITEEELGAMFLDLQNKGVHNINFVTPTHFLPQITGALAYAQEYGFSLPLVYNTSGYERAEIIRELDGIIDIYLPDMKYADNVLSKALSGADDYVENNREALKEMFRQKGQLVTQGGLAVQGVVIRHLVIPGHMENSRKVLKYIHDTWGKHTVVALMSQYFPAWNAVSVPDLNRRLKEEEYEEVVDYALSLGMESCLIQDLYAD